MAYTEEQRLFYSKAKEAGWEPEKIKAGIQRLGERAAAQPAPQQVMPDPNDPTRVDHGAAPDPYAQRVEEMNPAMRALMGVGGAVNNLAIGAQQLIPDALTSPEYRADLQRQAEQQKRAMAPLEATTAGQVGSIAGNVGAAIPAGMALAAAAPAGLAGAVGAGVLEGGLMGALAPTTQPGERAENIGYGSAFGGAVPVAGKAVRSLVGEGDEAVKKAAEVLKRYGVNVNTARQEGGALNKAADYIIESTPLLSNQAKKYADVKTDKVRDALFNMLGANAPKTNEEMAKITSTIGGDIGAMSKGKTVPVADIAGGVKDVMKDYKNLLPAQRNPQVMRYASQLTDLSKTKGAKLKGEAYQSIRADMASEAAKAAPEHAKALRGMVKVLDDEFAKTLKPEEAVELAAKKRQYRLAKILSGQDIKEGAMDMTKARAAIERSARKGEVMPAARELLNAADIGIPKIKAGTVASTPGVVAIGTAAVNPAIMAKALGGAGLAKALLSTGGPQRLVNSPLARKATARALKGAMQSELSDED
jgi:biotin operon repressor